MEPFEDMRILEFTGEPVHFYVRQQLTDYEGLAQNVKLDVVRMAMDGMIATLTSWCSAGRVPDNIETVTVTYPDGVWQTFKHLHMPHWFTLKFPVRMIHKDVTKTVNHYFVCPHIRTPALHQHIKFMATGTKLAGMMR